MFTNVGKNKIKSLLSDATAYGVVGSSENAESLNDSSLVSAFLTGSAEMSNSELDKQIIIDYTLVSTALQGELLGEFGIYSDDWLLLDRNVFSALVHNSTEQWQFSTRWFIN